MNRNYLLLSKKYFDEDIDIKPVGRESRAQTRERSHFNHNQNNNHHHHNYHHSHHHHHHESASESPVREETIAPSRYSQMPEDYEIRDAEAVLRSKWMDNSARMQRLREHRQKRLINKLEVQIT